MQTWYSYTDQRVQHTVVGDLRVTEGVYSPQLHNRRKLYVLLPASYEAEPARRYPVVYMQDGQNLFDQSLSYAGEWQVDETMHALAGDGIEAIVVGIPNMGVRRIDEYSPFKDARLHKGGRGDWYVAFMANTVKPLIDATFRTMPERQHTGVIGSSMGGLISLYTFFSRPDLFGMAGVMSPSLWFAQEAIVPFVRQAPFKPGLIYLDVGTHEGADTQRASRPPNRYTSRYLIGVRRMRALLESKGFHAGKHLLYVEEEQATHSEAAWARRLPDALRFMLAAHRRLPATAPAHAAAHNERWWEF
ncbi:MAG: alpha/beta hydrolase [Kouleothrix sp.]|jgi:predicted alpha/beta superfamily hydrolase|nr:alpha/beta hydrolase [Kouleothrix sp.]